MALQTGGYVERLDKNKCLYGIEMSDKSEFLLTDSYQVIDEKTWKRARHCMVFRNSIEPAFCVIFELDITNFLRKTKEQGYSFTLAMVYAVCKCASEIKEFQDKIA